MVLGCAEPAGSQALQVLDASSCNLTAPLWHEASLCICKPDFVGTGSSLSQPVCGM